MMGNDAKIPADAFAESPSDCAAAFREGVMRFRDEWNPAAPEFGVDINGRHVALSDLCGLVGGLGDRLPETVLDRLLCEIHGARHASLRAELCNDPSYATAAACLLTLMQDSRAALRRLEAERFRTPGVKLWNNRCDDGGSG